MAPIFSICIPTYNRAELLDYCLSRLSSLQNFSQSFEIVVSDNGSTDETPAVLDAHTRRNPLLRAYRLPENRGSYSNLLNALCKAEGGLAIYLADDDSLIPENLMRHLERMGQEPDLIAVYTDWIAWDDERGRELHRYFALDAPIAFGPERPLDLVNFVLQRMLPLEVGIYRREALLRSYAFMGRALHFHLQMYHLSRLGRIAFDPFPFYREHRVLRPGLRRTHWANIEMQLHFVGDELRIALESLLLLALHDSGLSQVPADQTLNAKQMIDRVVHARLDLEIERACTRGEWILAVELKRRRSLWNGPGSIEQVQKDVLQLSLPAALQAIQKIFHSLSGVEGISFRGFATGHVREFFARHYPGTRILGPGETGTKALIVHRDELTLAQDPAAGRSENVFVLERLIGLYRVVRDKVDIGGL